MHYPFGLIPVLSGECRSLRVFSILVEGHISAWRKSKVGSYVGSSIPGPRSSGPAEPRLW